MHFTKESGHNDILTIPDGGAPIFCSPYSDASALC